MIVSHRHKFVFIQLDQTASTAIARELCQHYGGEPMLWKHARYCDFMKVATPEEKEYFFFSGIRNPMDALVSTYLRQKSDRNKRFSGRMEGTSKRNISQYEYINRTSADFPEFFKRFFANDIYNEWKTKDFEKLDYVYRFEDVQDEFSTILGKLGVRQERPLDVFNEMDAGKGDFSQYYPPDIQGRARMVFGGYMKRWGYEFPEGWEQPGVWERIFVSVWLGAKHGFKRFCHVFIDTPWFYRTRYGFELKR